jgi:hypothetical protein
MLLRSHGGLASSTGLLALSFPLLSVFSLSVRFAVRKREAARREAWKGFLCTLLVVSGLTNLAAVIWFSLFHPGWLVSERQFVTAPPVRVSSGWIA